MDVINLALLNAHKNDKSVHSGSGSGSSALTKDITVNTSVDGIPLGKSYPKGTDLETIITDILVKYIKPGVSISISPNTTVYEVGSTISSLSITANVTKNSNAIANTKFYVGGTLVNTNTTQTDTGSITYNYTSGITSTTNVKSVVNDGKNDTTSNVITINFVYPMYVGLESGTLTKLVRVKGNYTYSNITCTNDSVIFKYPSSYGDLKSILDPNGFENLSSFTKTTETINSVSYNVYTSGKATLSGFSYTFKF